MLNAGGINYCMNDLPSDEKISWFRERLLEWFALQGRRFPWRVKSATNYKKIIVEVLLKRTQADTVAKFFPSFLQRFPSWKKLAQATEDELIEILKPIGLHRQRAASLKPLASEMARRKGVYPRTREEIEALPGVGQYVANAIELFVHGRPRPLVDTNMTRVLERFFEPRKLVDIRYDPYLQSLSQLVVSGENPVAINWALLDHAALICKQQLPKCNTCPLLERCRYGRQRGTHSSNI
jgi:A/G-specific adenine glycosylase